MYGIASHTNMNKLLSNNTCLPFSSFFQVDQPNFWDQVYKVQTERDIYEWYGLGPLLISALSLVSLERIFA